MSLPTSIFAEGAYRYIDGVFQYSAGVAALDGHEIVRVRFREPVPIAEGFERIAAFLASSDRPLASFCACELRSPAPFTEAGFETFNRDYVGTLERWGLYRDGRNPVARSNVCPEIDKPKVPSFHAFSFTRPAEGSGPSFIVAGSGEVPEGRGNYRDHIVRLGDLSPAGIRAKAEHVLATMEERLAALGAGWADTTATQIYTVHDIHPLLGDIVGRGAARFGATWHYCRPPVVDIEYEMDCRGVATERVI